jgi:hypothetical protein
MILHANSITEFWYHNCDIFVAKILVRGKVKNILQCTSQKLIFLKKVRCLCLTFYLQSFFIIVFKQLRMRIRRLKEFLFDSIWKMFRSQKAFYKNILPIVWKFFGCRILQYQCKMRIFHVIFTTVFFWKRAET